MILYIREIVFALSKVYLNIRFLSQRATLNFLVIIQITTS